MKKITVFDALNQAILNSKLSEASKSQYNIIPKKFKEFNEKLYLSQLDFTQAKAFLDFLKNQKGRKGEVMKIEVVREQFKKFCTLLKKYQDNNNIFLKDFYKTINLLDHVIERKEISFNGEQSQRCLDFLKNDYLKILKDYIDNFEKDGKEMTQEEVEKFRKFMNYHYSKNIHNIIKN